MAGRIDNGPAPPRREDRQTLLRRTKHSAGKFIADPVGVFVKYLEISEESLPKVSVHQEERVSGASRMRLAVTAAVSFALYAAVAEAFRGRQLRELALQVPNQERQAAL
jgi:hypothetical protein